MKFNTKLKNDNFERKIEELEEELAESKQDMSMQKINYENDVREIKNQISSINFFLRFLSVITVVLFVISFSIICQKNIRVVTNKVRNRYVKTSIQATTDTEAETFTNSVRPRAIRNSVRARETSQE